MLRRKSVLPWLAVPITLALAFGACAAQSTAQTTVTKTPTPTPAPPCTQLAPGATPFTSLSAVPGLSLPSGAYLTSGTHSGGGVGQYQVTTYTVCYQGAESAVNGPSGSTLSQLAAAGWVLNNLFPDPTNNAYLDYCSDSHNCVNSKGSPNPFTFVGFEQYVSHPNGYTTFTLQSATIAAPNCLNDPQYYSGTPKYTLYEDGSSASVSGDSHNHFQMPPATRVSTFLGGGTAGSTYVYFCSAGTQATAVSFLTQAMTNVGWTISNASGSGFSATFGSGPTYTIAVTVQNPNNYSLRIFVPM
jgi:hypothetical protein